MKLDKVQDEVGKIVIIEERLEPIGSSASGDSDNTERIISAAFGTVGGIIFFIVLLYLCKILRRRRRLRKTRGNYSNSSNTTKSSTIIDSIPTDVQLRTTEDVARRYERSVSSLSTKSQVYLVPFEVLPPDFDFSSREVEVKADYVILKDLKLLERYSSSNGGVTNEAYEQEESYNSSVWTIPPLIQEPYKKQPAYNPTFY